MSDQLDVILTNLSGQYHDPDAHLWADSPYRWIRNIGAPRTKGAVGERIVADYLTALGYTVDRSPDSQADRIVDGVRTEIKLSTPWADRTDAPRLLHFQQIRDQDYDTIIFLAVTPTAVRLWAIPKDVALAHATGQHGGAGAAETRWVEFAPDNVPDWLAPYGGDADTFAAAAAAAYTPTPVAA